MKAKEYAELYLKSDNKNEKAVEIVRMFAAEFDSLIRQRNITENQAVISLFKEVDKKYQVYVSIVNKKLPIRQPLLYHGFRHTMFRQFPELKQEINKLNGI